jgi:molybdopterin-containing oxidoreductase family iron-sulfur binding subunit
MKAPMRPTIPIAAAQDLGRRRFLKLVAASAALASSACKGPPAETIVPYVSMPEREVPGQPLFYASAFVRRGYAHGVLVETNGGRPTKVEGNPDHPVDAGATDVFMQASILQMWDPDRSQLVQQRTGDISDLSTWQAFEAALEARRPQFWRDGGAGLRILVGPSTSPTLARQLAGVLERYPNARWLSYDPLHDDGAHAATRIAFGRALDPVYRLDAVDVLLTLDADLFGGAPGAIQYARGFTARRRLGADASAGKGMNRLYALESTPTITGAYADERLARSPQAIEAALWRIAAQIGATPGGAPDTAADPVDARWEAAVAKALSSAQGRALVVAGPTLSPASRALVHLINQKLGADGGADGGAVSYIEPVLLGAPNHLDAIAALADDMHAGRVDTLLMLDTNPVYSAPADLRFLEALRRVPFSAHLGLYRDETARAALWHLPLAHNYEAWSDARAHDGTASIVQPLIAPLYEGRSIHAVLAMLDEGGTRDGHAIVRATWRHGDNGRDEKSNPGARYGQDIGTNPATTDDPGFERTWQDTLRRGLVANSAAQPVKVGAAALPTRPAQAAAAPLVAIFARDPAVDAGEFANNGWLQELPRPLTSLTWDNAALIGPRTASEAHLRTGDRIRLHAAGDAPTQPGRGGLVVPVLVMDEHAEGVITLPLGYGRTAAGGVGTGIGFDAYPLRTRAAWTAPLPVRMERAAGRHDFVVRQHEVDMHGRPIVEVSDLASLEGRIETGKGREPPQPTLYPEPARDPDSYRWGMAIDLNACIGCGTCTIACQAENNIPVVGKEEVARGRIMHWIRVDRYRIGTGAKQRTLFQPVPCMHCEHAPCEEVCPVGATMHDDEGLNVQVYNRCVGTRFCSNNCPYKVRRFNFLQYSNEKVESLKALQNPEVTVRHRGVMEKCTFCLQRITRARIDAEKRGSRIADGELVTACQQACPTSAIRFGDLNDPRADVVAAKAVTLDYVLLEELNTRPRTSYTTRVLNPDPELG